MSSHLETAKPLPLTEDELAAFERDVALYAARPEWSPSDGAMSQERATAYYEGGAAGYRLMTQPSRARLIATIKARDERIRALEWAARRAVREFRQRGNKDHEMDTTDAINALYALVTEEADDG